MPYICGLWGLSIFSWDSLSTETNRIKQLTILLQQTSYQLYYLSCMSRSERCLDLDILAVECPEELTCIICMQCMTAPHYADCGHVFGGNCIRSWKKADCPLCRQKVTTLTPHKELQQKAEVVEAVCKECETRLPAQQMAQHLSICTKNRSKWLAVLHETIKNQRQFLDIEINPHLFEAHGQIYDKYVNNWEWLSHDRREWKWWWWTSNPWWGGRCDQCNELWHAYERQIDPLDARRISIIEELRIETLQQTVMKE